MPRKKKRGPGRPKGSKNKPKTAGRPRTGRLETMSTAALAAELERRLNSADSLVQKRDDLLTELESVNAELEALGMAGDEPLSIVKTKKRGPGRPKGSKNKKKTATAGTSTVAKKSTARRGRRGKRPKNELSLVDALHTAIGNKTVSIPEAMQAVQDIGYKTTSPNFRTIVNQALGANTDKFKKVARGQYTTR